MMEKWEKNGRVENECVKMTISREYLKDKKKGENAQS